MRITREQKLLLIQFMEQHHDALFGFGNFCGNRTRFDLWSELTISINSLDVVNSRTMDQWKRVSFFINILDKLL